MEVRVSGGRLERDLQMYVQGGRTTNGMSLWYPRDGSWRKRGSRRVGWEKTGESEKVPSDMGTRKKQ